MCWFAVIEQPQSSVEVEEHKNASIVCKFAGTDISPNWLINESAYTPSFLPSKHYYNGTNLIIVDVSMASNGTTYCCFLLFWDGSNITSDVATLMVTSKIGPIFKIYKWDYFSDVLESDVPVAKAVVHGPQRLKSGRVNLCHISLPLFFWIL